MKNNIRKWSSASSMDYEILSNKGKEVTQLSIKLRVILKLIKNVFKSIMYVLNEDPLTIGDTLEVTIKINIERPKDEN